MRWLPSWSLRISPGTPWAWHWLLKRGDARRRARRWRGGAKRRRNGASRWKRPRRVSSRPLRLGHLLGPTGTAAIWAVLRSGVDCSSGDPWAGSCSREHEPVAAPEILEPAPESMSRLLLRRSLSHLQLIRRKQTFYYFYEGRNFALNEFLHSLKIKNY